MDPDFVPPPFITFAIPFFFLLMAVEYAIGHSKKETYYRFNDSISDLSTGILSQLSGIFLKTLTLFGYFYIFENFRITTFTISSPISWILAIILWDFFYYWLHRLSHEVNILWAGHVIHHHSEEYNLIVALRQTSLGGIFSWVFFIPMAVIGIDPWVYLAAGQINLIYQYWVHTKSVRSIGTLGEYLLSTPSHHRVHHAINPKYIDKNHGGIFIIWDRLFGTFQKEEEEPVYGTVKPLRSFNPIWANYHYYYELIHTAWKTEGFQNKLKVFYKPPGYFPPEQGKEEGFVEIPGVSVDTFQKYNPVLTRGKKLYILAWFIFILLVSFSYLLFLPRFGWSERLSLSLWIAFSLLVLNALMEDKKWANALDLIRILSTPGALFLLYMVFNKNA